MSFQYTVGVVDDIPGDTTYSAYSGYVQKDVDAALQIWGRYITGLGSIDVQVHIQNVDGPYGILAETSYASATRWTTDGASTVWLSGTASELRTGIDPNGATPDINVYVDGGDLSHFFFDLADPVSRTAPVPSNEIDFMSVILHELGHGFGFGGYGDGSTPMQSGAAESGYDRYVRFYGGSPYFVGPTAEAVYGGPVPLTPGSYYHYGVNSGIFLPSGLMNPEVDFGVRNSISQLDLAILQDSGIPVVAGAIGSAPVITPAEVANYRHQAIAATALFHAFDPDGDAISKYQLFDNTTDGTSGYFTVSGVAQPARQTIEVNGPNLGTVSFIVGQTSDDIYVRASDGSYWSSWTLIHVTALDHAPAVTVQDLAATTHNRSFAAAAMVTASDPDAGDQVTRYEFWEGNDDTGAGSFVLNGVAQPTRTVIDLTPGHLGDLSFQSGAGTARLYVRASDGQAWSDWQGFNVVGDHAPDAIVPAGHQVTATKNSAVALSSLFQFSDPDAGDTLQHVQVWDDTSDPASGHFVVSGVAQSAGHPIDLTLSQAAQTVFQTAASGSTDDVYVRVSDGLAWSDWRWIHLSAPDHAPTVGVQDLTATKGESYAAAALFTASDPDAGDQVTRYEFWEGNDDTSAGSFVLNGVAQPTRTVIDLTPDHLANLSFQTGAGTARLYVRASDGQAWSDWQGFNVAAPVNHAPDAIVAAGHQVTVAKGSAVALSSLFQFSDPDAGDTLQHVQVWDDTSDPASGHFVVNGVAQSAGHPIDLTLAQVAQTVFQTAAAGSTDDVYVRVSDGAAWSDWRWIHVSAPDHAPTVGVQDLMVATKGQSYAATSLFTASDPDAGDQVTRYEFWEGNDDMSAGSFVLNGVAQLTRTVIDLTADHLGDLSFQSLSGTARLYVRASDGQQWSDWQGFNVAAPVDHAPDVTMIAKSFTVGIGGSIAIAPLFTTGDPDAGDAIVRYQVWDDTANPASGHFVVGGTVEPAGGPVNVLAGDLAQTSFVAGSVSGVDHLALRASDGVLWSEWRTFDVFTHA